MVASGYIQYSYSARISKDITVRMLSAYLKRPYEFFLGVNSADVLRACTTDTLAIYNIISTSMQIFTELLSIALIGTFLIHTEPFIAISSLGLMLVILVVMIMFFKPAFKKLGRESINVITRKNRILYQVTGGIKDIYVTNRQDIFLAEYEDTVEKERIINKKRDSLNVVPDRLTEAICVFGIIGAIILKVVLFNDAAVDFIPKLSAFAMAAFKIYPSVGKITTRINHIVYYVTPLENVYRNFKEIESEDLNQMSSVYYDDSDVKMDGSDIVCKGVSFKYSNQTDYVLHDVSFKIRRGEFFGIVGESGAGKSTMVDILLGLLIPQKGSIRFNGIDVFSNKKMWASKVGYVPQSVFLLDDTIRNNILFGAVIEKDGTDSAVWDAIEKAQLTKFVKSLPDGLDTKVGERGVRLSGGQRQRIAIARALYSRPEIIIMDEATAALDNDTEKALIEAVEALQGNITIIMIAHRLTTIRNCDRVYEIKDGLMLEGKKQDIVIDNLVNS